MAGVPGFVVGGGYREEIAAVNVAVQYAGLVPLAVEVGPVGVHVGVPMTEPLFVNCTVPVGPLPKLCVFTTAVRVTLVPDVMEVALLETVTDVDA